MCDDWRRETSRNPCTRRPIRVGGPTHRRLDAACGPAAACTEWRARPDVNPLSGRRIGAGGRIYANLTKLCACLDADGARRDGARRNGARRTENSRGASSSGGASRVDSNNAAGRALSTIQRLLLRKGDSFKARLAYDRLMRAYLSDLEPCLRPGRGGRVVLSKRGDHRATVMFRRQIGSPSAYGAAYMTTGPGLAGLLRFSAKTMEDSTQHRTEVALLGKMSAMVRGGMTPNLPLTYASLRCPEECTAPECPAAIKDRRYLVVINELADMDLLALMQGALDARAAESVVMQVLFGLYAFHGLGYAHNDAHLANYLVHRVTPGGYWVYRVNDTNVFVPNAGHLVVLWDPGLASRMTSDAAYRHDYGTLRTLGDVAANRVHASRGAVPLPAAAATAARTMYEAIQAAAGRGMAEADVVPRLCAAVRAGVIRMDHVIVGDPRERAAPATVRAAGILNPRPFAMRPPSSMMSSPVRVTPFRGGLRSAAPPPPPENVNLNMLPALVRVR